MPLSHPTFLKLKKLLAVDDMEEVALLVAGLDLEVVGWWGCCYSGSVGVSDACSNTISNQTVSPL